MPKVKKGEQPTAQEKMAVDSSPAASSEAPTLTKPAPKKGKAAPKATAVKATTKKVAPQKPAKASGSTTPVLSAETPVEAVKPTKSAAKAAKALVGKAATASKAKSSKAATSKAQVTGKDTSDKGTTDKGAQPAPETPPKKSRAAGKAADTGANAEAGAVSPSRKPRRQKVAPIGSETASSEVVSGEAATSEPAKAKKPARPKAPTPTAQAVVVGASAAQVKPTKAQTTKPPTIKAPTIKGEPKKAAPKTSRKKPATAQVAITQADAVTTTDTAPAAPTDLLPAVPVQAPQQPEGNQDFVGQSVTDLITAQLRKMGRPVHIRDFERSLTRVAREKLGRNLDTLLEDLTHQGVIIRTRRNTYGLPEAMNLVRGRFQASAGGFGFVIPDSGGDDFYVREGETLEAWNGDTVLIRPEGRPFEREDRYDRRRNQRGNQKRAGNSRNDSPRASVVRIVTRAYSRLVGSLEYLKGYAFLKPDDHRARHRIMLVQDEADTLAAGSRVVTQLFWPEDTGEDEVYGEVVRVLGAEDDAETETQAVIIKYGLHNEFPPEVLAEAEKIPGKVPAKAIKGRLDLREYNIFTVDGSDAKDFDDAIHIKGTPEGNFEVGIHIADVSHYVLPGTALDDEAYARATSVYLPGSVLPMLPEHLSNGVCSLVPYEDRLTMSAIIELSAEGEILQANFAPSVIRSKARLTYDEVQAYSEASATLPEHARALEGDLHLLLKLTAKLRQKRLREGSLDFKMREVKVDIGAGGHMQLIPLHEETARGMIEDLMLLANKAVAHFLLEKNVPTLYRIHEEPTLGRFQETSAAIARMGLSFPGGEPTPQAYQAVLKAVRGTAQESVVNTLLLRSMQQAKYAEENLGHFGLAFEEYLHFTSPIRRYPDLLVHRALRLTLQGDVSDRTRAELAAPLAEQGRHTSERERNAAEAERDLTKYYQCKWAEEHLGESFEGRVSGVIASGLFVALENGVEGRLHISNLDDDYYVFIEEASILKGRSNGRSYRIGDTIQVNISKVNPLARQIDFAQENSMDDNEQKPRVRRRDERDATRRTSTGSTFAPKKKLENGPFEGEGQLGAALQTPGVTPERTERSQPAREPHLRRESVGAGVRRDGGRSYGRSAGSQGQGGYRRRVITLERPRNEHLRPVNITVQRMYFGDWTLENMPPEEGNQGERTYRSGGNFRGRGSSQQGQSRPPRDSQRSGGREGGQRERSASNAASSERAQAQEARSVPEARTGSSESEEAKRRRRRRGRRGGSGGENSGSNNQE